MPSSMADSILDFHHCFQVLVEVKAAGVNPADTYKRSGNYAIKPPLPYTPGADAAGVIKEIGKNVTKFKVPVYLKTM